MKKILVFFVFVFIITQQKGITVHELQAKIDGFNKSPLVSLLLIHDSLSPNAEALQMLMKDI
jgi:hypothetical protein